MKNITIKILAPEDEALIMGVLAAFQKSGKVELEIPGNDPHGTDSFDKNDEEILDLLDRADREKGVPFEELRKRPGP